MENCNCIECFEEEWNKIGEFFCEEHQELFEKFIESLKDKK